MSIDLTRDRRLSKRLPKMMRFVLLARRVEESAFSTDVSRCGIFLRTAIAPPLGSEITLLVPEGRSNDECIRIYGTVARTVRRGDPINPLGGIGISMTRLDCPRGVRQAQALLTSLLGDLAPELTIVPGPVTVEFPSFQVISGKSTSPKDEQKAAPTSPVDGAVHSNIAVFCKWQNMIIKARLCRLGPQQAILRNLKIRPAIGDKVTVRVLSLKDLDFGGTEFTGQVDLNQYDDSPSESFISLALDSMSTQSDLGGLRAILRQVEEQGENESADMKDGAA